MIVVDYIFIKYFENAFIHILLKKQILQHEETV